MALLPTRGLRVSVVLRAGIDLHLSSPGLWLILKNLPRQLTTQAHALPGTLKDRSYGEQELGGWLGWNLHEELNRETGREAEWNKG